MNNNLLWTDALLYEQTGVVGRKGPLLPAQARGHSAVFFGEVKLLCHAEFN